MSMDNRNDTSSDYNPDWAKEFASYDDPSKIVNDHYVQKISNDMPEYKAPIFLVILRAIFVWIFDSVQIIVIALAIFIISYLFVVSPHTIDGQSMEPNFCHADLILADKLTPRFNPYKVGDVIVFEHDVENDYIKRIMGVGGDRVMIRDGHVFRNGSQLDESYLPGGRTTTLNPGDMFEEGKEITVPEGKYLVFGDNRHFSSDSRHFGVIDPKLNLIKGRVLVVMWPFSRARLFKVEKVLPENECQSRVAQPQISY